MRLRRDSTWPLLALVIAVGAALRLYGLDQQSLWNDELSAWTQYRLATWQEVVKAVSAYHPPGYWAVMHFWVRALGDSETMLRLPSAIAGIAAIPAMFALGKRLYGPPEGLIAAALTATAWTPIYYSQEARAYMLLMLSVVLSSSWLIDVVRALRRERPLPIPTTIGYIVAAELACYFHHAGLLFTVLQGALVGLLFRRRPAALLRLAAVYGVVALGYLPWLRRAATDLSGGPEWLRPPELIHVALFIRSLFNESNTIACLVLALSATLAIRAIDLLRQRQAGRLASSPDALLLVWLVVPVAILYLRSRIAAPVFGDRYLIIVAPAAYLLVARAVTQLPFRRVTTPVVAAVLPSLLVVHLLFVKDYFTRPDKEQFRAAAAYLVRHDLPEAKAVILACAWNREYFDYYLGRLGSTRRVDRLAETAHDRTMIAQLIEARAPDDVWLLAGHKIPAPDLVASLADDLRLVGEAHFHGADVWHFVPRGPSNGSPGSDG